MHKAGKPDDLSNYTCRGEFDPFAAGHGCSSISSGLGIVLSVAYSSLYLTNNLLTHILK